MIKYYIEYMVNNMKPIKDYVKVSIERDVVNILKSRLTVGETYSSLLRKILK